MSAEKTAAPARVISYYSVPTGTTTHIVCRADATEALVIDPVPFEPALYDMILARGLTVETILLTVPQRYMNRGVRTLQKIFPCDVVCGSSEVPFDRVYAPADHETIDRCSLRIEAIPVRAHSRFSFLYVIEDCAFTGTIVHAGTIGDTANAFAEALLVAGIKDSLFRLPDEYLILPSVGPPSTIGVERRLSPHYRSSELSEDNTT